MECLYQIQITSILNQGSVSGGLGLRKFLDEQGHTFIVTSDKDGADSVFEKELLDADVIISQPFWPAYITKEVRGLREKRVGQYVS